MKSISHFVLKYKALVVLLWIAAMVGGVVASGALSDRYKSEFGYPGYEGYEANVAILKKYHNGAYGNPIVPVITLPAGVDATSAAVREPLQRAFDGLRENGLRTISYPQTGDKAFITSDGRTLFALVFTPMFSGEEGPPDELVDQVEQAVAAAAPQHSTVRITGIDQLADLSGGETEDGNEWVETAIGAGGALIVLLFVFASFLALVPLLIAAVSILTTNMLIFGLTGFMDIGNIISYIVGLIGLGIAIDYSLLVVNRWREERSRGLDKVAATHKAVATAGHAVVFSSLAVAAGLLVLVMLPVEFLQSIGAGSVLIPLVSAVVSLTLLPVLLATVGDKLAWPRIRKERSASRLWTKWAHGVARRPIVAAIAALAVLVPLVIAAFSMHLGSAPSDSLAQRGPAREAVETLESGNVPSGVLTPIEVLVPRGTDPKVVAQRLENVDGVYSATAPDYWSAGNTSLVNVIPEEETATTQGRALVGRVIDEVADMDGVRVGGSGAMLRTDIEAIYGRFPLMLAIVALATFVLLIRAFRSVVLALQAIVVNLLSIGAAYGVLVLVWQEGYGSQTLWGIDALGSVTVWVPLMTFAFLFGLSMDYQVFLMSRMREQYDTTGNTTDAIVTGLGRIGRLVTSAALILFLAFVALSATPEVDVKVMATGLGAAILLDATVLRMLLVPALTALTGRYTWWLPKWIAAVLRVQASPLPERVAHHRIPVRS